MIRRSSYLKTTIKKQNDIFGKKPKTGPRPGRLPLPMETVPIFLRYSCSSSVIQLLLLYLLSDEDLVPKGFIFVMAPPRELCADSFAFTRASCTIAISGKVDEQSTRQLHTSAKETSSWRCSVGAKQKMNMKYSRTLSMSLSLDQNGEDSRSTMGMRCDIPVDLNVCGNLRGRL